MLEAPSSREDRALNYHQLTCYSGKINNLSCLSRYSKGSGKDRTRDGEEFINMYYILRYMHKIKSPELCTCSTLASTMGGTLFLNNGVTLLTALGITTSNYKCY